MMSGVTPLAGSDRSRAMREAGQSATDRETEEARERLRALALGETRFEWSDDGERVEGRRVDLAPETARKLRRGAFPIDARLDLHGLRPGEAREKVGEFLRDKRARGERCVLVIHGKGEGVLRGEVAAWLAQGSASAHVAAFATAVGEDGGQGAVYVLLRTNR
jgi:DNA-nicking Smr family endonuclease